MPIHTIYTNNSQNPSMSMYSTDSLSIDSDASFLNNDQINTTAETSVESDSASDSADDNDEKPRGISGSLPGIATSASSNGPGAIEGGSESSGKSNMTNTTEDQLREAGALRSIPVYEVPSVQQPIKRKMLPLDNKAASGLSEPIELSEDGERFSKELELRFFLAETLDIPTGMKPAPSRCSTMSSKSEKSVELELLCYPSYGKEIAVEVEAPRHRSIRETFQSVVGSSSSMRWLKSIGKGKKKFSRPPIPNF